MKHLFGSLCVCVIFSACDDTPALAPTPTPTLSAIFLSFSGGGINPEGELLVGRTVQFTAFARYSDGTGQTVTTSVAAWQTANAGIATVSAGGLVQGVGPGITAITATYQGVAGSLNVVVAP